MQKYLFEFDSDHDGMLDFEEFKNAMKNAQRKMKDKERKEKEENEYFY